MNSLWQESPYDVMPPTTGLRTRIWGTPTSPGQKREGAVRKVGKERPERTEGKQKIPKRTRDRELT